MRRAYPCHAVADAFDRAPSSREADRSRVDSIDLLDTARCPCCRYPLIACMGRAGPYFHCGCSEGCSVRRDPKGSAVW